MGQSYKQYLPEYVRRRYRCEKKPQYWQSRSMRMGLFLIGMVLVTLIGVMMIPLILGFDLSTETFAMYEWTAKLSFGIGVVLLVVSSLVVKDAQWAYQNAVAWVDDQMEYYGIKPEAFERGKCLQILAALAHLLHASTTTVDAQVYKHQLRQFHGLIELLYGESYASDLNHSVSVLRGEVLLEVLTRLDSQIPDTLRLRLSHSRQTAA